MIKTKAKGAKVIVACEGKQNQDATTESGLYVAAKPEDAGDTALLSGEVVSTGTKELRDDGSYRVPDVCEGDTVWFNRYNAFKVITRGLRTYWVVDCNDIWATGDL
jgi:co-chaperonin GroES (HSP10)